MGPLDHADRRRHDHARRPAHDGARPRARRQHACSAYAWPGRLRRAGVENLRLRIGNSTRPTLTTRNTPGPESSIENAEDVWVRQVTVRPLRRLGGRGVGDGQAGDGRGLRFAASRSPRSAVYRRHTFFTAGSRRCSCAAGAERRPARLRRRALGRRAERVRRMRGAATLTASAAPVESWASGVLYDNVDDRRRRPVADQPRDGGQGVGWAAANSVLWQCTAPVVTCRTPPGGAELGDRLLGAVPRRRALAGSSTSSSSRTACIGPNSPSGSGARRSRTCERRPDPGRDPAGDRRTARSRTPQPAGRGRRGTRLIAPRTAGSADDGGCSTGGRLGTTWWRGHTLPSRETAEFGVGVTRFVPGRDGPGLHRRPRRADRRHVRRRTGGASSTTGGSGTTAAATTTRWSAGIDGDVWPPFYEQPWARQRPGHGLGRPEQVRPDEVQPLVLRPARRSSPTSATARGWSSCSRCYFQHNILEAGAHWADFPWRPANCLQDTGFPEPPPYAGNKRIFMAEAFYDVSHPVRRGLHRRYIRHCLDVLGDAPERRSS